jgi:hypothetical protein
LLQIFAEMIAYFGRVGQPGDPGKANRLLGAPSITLDEWIKERQSQLVEEGLNP